MHIHIYTYINVPDSYRMLNRKLFLLYISIELYFACEMSSFEILDYMYYTRLKDILFWRGGSHFSPHLDSSNG